MDDDDGDELEKERDGELRKCILASCMHLNGRGKKIQVSLDIRCARSCRA